MKLILLMLVLLIVSLLYREQIMALVNPTQPAVNKQFDDVYKNY